MTALGYDALVEQIMTATKCDRAKAEQVARLNGAAPPAPDPGAAAESQRKADALEKDEQREVWKRFTVCGFRGYWLSQARETKQTPGLADLWFAHRALPIALWWETKRQVGGRHSEAQKDFAEECIRCGIPYGTGDRFDAERWLIERGLARHLAGAFEPVANAPGEMPARADTAPPTLITGNP